MYVEGAILAIPSPLHYLPALAPNALIWILTKKLAVIESFSFLSEIFCPEMWICKKEDKIIWGQNQIN